MSPHVGLTLVAAGPARMGHASTRAAMIYQHATQDRDAVIAAALNELVEAAQRKRTQVDAEGDSGTFVARDA